MQILGLVGKSYGHTCTNTTEALQRHYRGTTEGKKSPSKRGDINGRRRKLHDDYISPKRNSKIFLGENLDDL
jgi:hypothetical protein